MEALDPLLWVAKFAGSKVMDEMGGLLSPRQVRYGVRGGAEATVHAARLYLNNLDSASSVVKLDFKNAYNSIRRDKMMLVVLELCPALFHFVHSVYSTPSSLFLGS